MALVGTESLAPSLGGHVHRRDRLCGHGRRGGPGRRQRRVTCRGGEPTEARPGARRGGGRRVEHRWIVGGGSKLTAAVKTHVEQALLQSSDFPSGWTSSGKDSSQPHLSVVQEPGLLRSVPSAIAAIKPTKVSGPEYTSPDKTLAVEDSISVYPTTAEGKAAWKAMASAKTPTCMDRIGSAALRTSVQDEAGSGASVGTVKISALAPGTYEAGQTGYTVTIPLVSDGRQLIITSTEIDLRPRPLRAPAHVQRQRGASSRRSCRCTSSVRSRLGPEPAHSLLRVYEFGHGD